MKLFELGDKQGFSLIENQLDFGFETCDVHFQQGTSVALGFFDGVHLGHQEIINRAKKFSKELNLKSVVVTFENHPRSLTISKNPSLITDFTTRLRIFAQLGIDYVLAIKFSDTVMNLSAEEYLNKYILKVLNAKCISVGYDHCFGKERSGNIEFLKIFCRKHALKLSITEPFRIDGDLVSSSRIRELLMLGDIKTTNFLLGRYFMLKGSVIHGDKRGREIGFPTANLKISTELIKPATGVYFCKCLIYESGTGSFRGMEYEALVNIGYRPTFTNSKKTKLEDTLSIEAHLVDFSGDLYGKELEIAFIDRIRDEKRFSSKEELITQIKEDLKWYPQGNSNPCCSDENRMS